EGRATRPHDRVATTAPPPALPPRSPLGPADARAPTTCEPDPRPSSSPPPGSPPVMRQRPHYQIPCVHAIRMLAPRPKILGRVELWFDRRDDRFCDLILHCKHLGKVAVVVLGPKVASGGDVVKLRSDTHAIVALAHATLDDVADAELLCDPLDMNRFALVDE